MRKFAYSLLFVLGTCSTVSIASVAHAEVDSVAYVYNGSYNADITDSVLKDLGLDASEWQLCRVKDANPDDQYDHPHDAHVTDNRLYVGAWEQLKEGETAQETLLVQACSETQILDWSRLALIVKEPFHPVIETHLTPTKRCQVSLTDMDDTLTAQLGLATRIWTDLPSLTAAPGQTMKYTFARKLPKTVFMYSSLFNEQSYIGQMSLVLNTKTCVYSESLGK